MRAASLRWRHLACCLFVVIAVCYGESNSTLNSGNPLWEQLNQDCAKSTTVRCVQKSLFGYLDHALGKDVVISDGFAFRRNRNDGVSDNPGAKSLLGESDVAGTGSRTLNTVDNIADNLYGKGVQFFRTHDVELTLPDFFGGAEIRVSPRSFENDGAIVKISFTDPQDKLETSTGRGILKKITQKLFKKKLMSSFFALLLVVKLIKVKLMFLLPLIMGVGTAKKLLLKVLLFLFPALSHLFKLCSYYHSNYAKYHHHHHKIAHHHHVIPVPVPAPVHISTPPVDYSHSYPSHPSYPPEPAPYPPAEHYGPPPGHSSGPSYHDELPGPHGSSSHNPYSGWNRNENIGVLPAQRQPAELQTAWNSYKTAAANMIGSPGQKTSGLLVGVKKKPAEETSVAKKPAVAAPVGPTIVVAYDPFYSPILQKIDDIFVQLGFNEEACRERLVCAMYKTPERFSPHSNLISTHLSREPSELQKPASLNSAVVRFYRYVQAAREGQNQKDCIKLYPACTVNTDL